MMSLWYICRVTIRNFITSCYGAMRQFDLHAKSWAFCVFRPDIFTFEFYFPVTVHWPPVVQASYTPLRTRNYFIMGNAGQSALRKVQKNGIL